MTMKIKKGKKAHVHARSTEAMTAILHCKGGPMSDRRLRRAKNAKRSWKSEEAW